ncbi:hypothetical protein C9975_10060, partial [Thalassospira xiamenensis]
MIYNQTSPFKTPEKSSPFKPVMALCLHSNGSDYITTTHKTNNNGDMGVGRVVEIADAISLMQQKSGMSEQRSGWNISRVIYDSPNVLAWSLAPQKQKLWFSVRGRIAVDAIIPKTIFVLRRSPSRSDLHVFACANSSVGKDTKLYHAPYMNVNSMGHLCQGSATLPVHTLHTDETLLKGCEETLFDSVFTHQNHALTWKPKKGKNSVSD